MTIEHGILSMPAGTAWKSSGEDGWMFTANETFKVCGFRSSTPSDDTGTTCNLWDVSSGTLIATAEIVPGPDWTEVYLDKPVTLENGKRYVASKVSTSVFYFNNTAGNATFNPKVTYVTGVYRRPSNGTMPVTQEPGYMYPFVDILIGEPPSASAKRCIVGNTVGVPSAQTGAAVEEMSVDTLDSIWNEVFTGGDVSE